MFELNNLALFVPSPLQRWLDLLSQLPPGEQEAAYAAAGAGAEGRRAAPAEAARSARCCLLGAFRSYRPGCAIGLPTVVRPRANP